MPKQKVFVGRSKEEVQGKIAEWVAADPSILEGGMHFGGAMFFTDYSMSAPELARALEIPMPNRRQRDRIVKPAVTHEWKTEP
jgi:hypothetical protein